MGAPVSLAARAFASLVWALHPMRAEVLGWLSAQGYLVATAFSLASVRATVAALHARKRKRKRAAGVEDSPHRTSVVSWVRSVAWFVLACGSKAVRVWRFMEIGSGRPFWVPAGSIYPAYTHYLCASEFLVFFNVLNSLRFGTSLDLGLISGGSDGSSGFFSPLRSPQPQFSR